MRLTFNLPYENDLSGVGNILFRNKETGAIHLLDSINKNERYYNKLSGTYDAILLYNNGKYLIYRDIELKKNADLQIDMQNIKPQPKDYDSAYWLTLRSFTDSAGNKERVLSKKIDSDKKVIGYVLIEDGFAADFPFVRIVREIRKNDAPCSYDGYFEIDIDEPIVTLEFFCIGHNFEELNVKENSGVFYVLDSPDPEETINITTSR